jgi:hypothetical protein
VQELALQSVGRQIPPGAPLVTQVALVPQLSPGEHTKVQMPLDCFVAMVLHSIAFWPAQSLPAVQYFPTPRSLPAWPTTQQELAGTVMSTGTAHTPNAHMREAHRSLALSPAQVVAAAPQ